jgi:hypothetical protein
MIFAAVTGAELTRLDSTVTDPNGNRTGNTDAKPAKLRYDAGRSVARLHCQVADKQCTPHKALSTDTV